MPRVRKVARRKSAGPIPLAIVLVLLVQTFDFVNGKTLSGSIEVGEEKRTVNDLNNLHRYWLVTTIQQNGRSSLTRLKPSDELLVKLVLREEECYEQSVPFTAPFTIERLASSNEMN